MDVLTVDTDRAATDSHTFSTRSCALAVPPRVAFEQMLMASAGDVKG